MTIGQGYLWADWLLAILVTLCALGHLAIMRAPDIRESEIIGQIRRIKIAGLLILGLRFWYAILIDGDLIVPPPSLFGMTLIFGAEFYRCIYRLFQAKMDAHEAMQSMRDRRKVAR